MEEIANKLRRQSYRFTKQRQQIIDSLTVYPQSASQIASTLKRSGLRIDKVTVYRTLDFLVNLGIACKTQFEDKISRYEVLSPKHHHHLVCNNCGFIQDISLEESFLINKIRKQTNFQIKSHSLEFFGVCPNCQ